MMSFWSNMSFDLIPSSVSLEKHGNHAVDLDTGEVKFKDKAYWNASKTVLGENTNAREKARAYEIRSRFLIETTKKIGIWIEPGAADTSWLSLRGMDPCWLSQQASIPYWQEPVRICDITMQKMLPWHPWKLYYHAFITNFPI